jgi:hypothetical protein
MVHRIDRYRCIPFQNENRNGINKYRTNYRAKKRETVLAPMPVLVLGMPAVRMHIRQVRNNVGYSQKKNNYKFGIS